MNAIKPDAVALGNHEFDRGVPPIARFCEGAAFPLLSANLDVSNEPKLKELVKPSVILKVGGEEVGVVGAITEDLMSISSPGDSLKLKPLVPSVQAAVDDLLNKGVNKIVLVTHIGYQEDIKLASQLRGVDLIIGGHSHTPIGTPALPGWPASRGAYPTLQKDVTGRNVYIFQAWEWGKVFGRFKADFDEKGEIVRIHEAAAIPVDASVPEDPGVKSIVDALKLPILELQNKAVGAATNEISREATATGEIVMGNVIADSMLAETAKLGAVAAFTNSGGVRANIDAGPITYGEAIAVVPFSNTLVLLELTGQEIFDSIQFGVGRGGKLLPSKGTRYEAVNGKVTQVVLAGQPLDLNKRYTVALNSFIASGGDGHEVLKNATGKRTDTGFLDIDALINYLKANDPLNAQAENRIVIRNDEEGCLPKEQAPKKASE
jgi:5'-nucleotidase